MAGHTTVFSSKRFLRIVHALTTLGDFFVGLAVLLVLLLVCAVLLDPRGDFNTGVFPTIVRDSRSHKMKSFSLKNVSQTTEGLVFGSSRAMKLDPKDLESATGYRFFNFAVDSARAEDYLAIYRWARAKGASPRLIVVGLDLEALHDNDVPDNRLTQNEELNAVLTGKHISKTLIRLRALKSTLTIAYLEDMARSIKQIARPVEAVNSYDQDGYLRYSKWERLRATGKFNFHDWDQECHAEYVARFIEMKKLSPARKQSLEKFIDEALADGAKVVLFVTPVHPDISVKIGEKTRYISLLKDLNHYLAELSVVAKIKVYDYSVLSNFGGTLTGWYDCGHTDEANSLLMVKGLSGDLHR